MAAAEVTRLLDAGHARLAEQMITLVQAAEWSVIVHYTFSHYGERGAVDIVGWHPATRHLLIVEIKTMLLDIQDVLARSIARSGWSRSSWPKERGWEPVAVGRLVVCQTHPRRGALSVHMTRRSQPHFRPGPGRCGHGWSGRVALYRGFGFCHLRVTGMGIGPIAARRDGAERGNRGNEAGRPLDMRGACSQRESGR